MEKIKILAGIVLFNPEIDRLKMNISAIIDQVDYTILVDNGSKNILDIKKLMNDFPNINLIELGDNKGIAFALNKIGQYAVEYEFDYFITLDQDSVVMKNLVKEYKKYLNLPFMGQLTNYIEDRNNPIDRSKIILKENGAITSSALMPTDVYKSGIKYDDDLFIDKVDFDINIQLKKAGFKSYQIPYVGLLHEVGNQTQHSFLGLKVMTYNHSAMRRYFISRNSIYLIKKYGFREAGGFLIGDVSRFIKTILYEKDKIKKNKASIKGLRDGIFNKNTHLV
ncbi:glycosyltransferase [Lactococcus lactis]|uniref:glycosyltransferase n=1 Tax=Lactococcus lactis TaxID=1358 RepID=UPI00223BC0F3|nr:glycosyltransferase [Lactococcus lactis]MCT1191521.1 glycosyltransferase [Lactococcus lactis]